MYIGSAAVDRFGHCRIFLAKIPKESFLFPFIIVIFLPSSIHL